MSSVVGAEEVSGGPESFPWGWTTGVSTGVKESPGRDGRRTGGRSKGIKKTHRSTVVFRSSSPRHPTTTSETGVRLVARREPRDKTRDGTFLRPTGPSPQRSNGHRGPVPCPLLRKYPTLKTLRDTVLGGRSRVYLGGRAGVGPLRRPKRPTPPRVQGARRGDWGVGP